MSENQGPKLNVFISDYDLHAALTAAVERAVTERVGPRIEELVEQAIEQQLKSKIATITDDLVRAEITKALETGWQKTNQYGEPLRGAEPMTLSSAVREALASFSQPENSYSKESKLTKTITEMADASIREELTPIIDEAKKNLRNQLDLSIGKSLRVTIADALRG